MVARRPGLAAIVAVAAAAAIAAMPAAAEVEAGAQASVGVKLRILESLVREAPGDWGFFSAGSARLSVSTATQTVKAELALDALLGADTQASLARASVSARFPRWRVTLGKARLSWGQGFAFNAGDLIFGGTSAVGLDLSAEALRDDAAWLASVYVPLGGWSFAEAVLLPPALSLADLIRDPATPLPDPATLAAGARFQAKLGGVMIEPAYLYRGPADSHEVALTLQGNLFVDLNASLGTRSAGELTADALREGLRVSAGLYHLQRLGRLASLSIRLEALVTPSGEWSEVEPPAGAPDYGLLVYPELALVVEQALTLTARALVSPVDGSALLVPGVSVSVHKGLTFLALASVGVGDETDTWSFERPGGLSFAAGCAYSY